MGELETKPAKRSPAPPFTTSTLQQEASRKLGFSVAQTMQVAQKLYEAGLITYMRTDSVNLSEQAIQAAEQEISSFYGSEFSKSRRFKSKSKGAQEAHEAIRPSYMERHSIEGDARQVRLYDLIWKRTIASQMSDAQLERTTVHIPAPDAAQFVAKGEVIKFEGFLKVYLEGTDDDLDAEEKGVLPAMRVGQLLDRKEVEATERFARPPARFTEQSGQKTRGLGIGRLHLCANDLHHHARSMKNPIWKGSSGNTDRSNWHRSNRGLRSDRDHRSGQGQIDDYQ